MNRMPTAVLVLCALPVGAAVAMAAKVDAATAVDAPYTITAKAPLTRQGCSVMEADQLATGGQALRMAPEKKQAGTVSDYYIYPAYPGRYRFTWRLKINDNSAGAMVVELNPLFPATPAARNPTRSLSPPDWKAAGAYQDFSIEGVVPEHDYGVLSSYFDPAPGRSVWWDNATFTRLERFDDTRIAATFYPAFSLPPQLTRSVPAGTTDKPRTLVLYQPASYEASGLRGALAGLGLQAPPPQQLPADMRSYAPPAPRQAGQWRELAVIDHPQSRLPAPGFPDTAAAFADLDLIVLDDVSPRALTAPSRLLLSAWVRQAGGRLLLMGGMHAFGKGQCDGTALEAMLPVELAGSNDLKPARMGGLVFRDAGLAAIAGDAALGTKFYQALKPRTGARILIEAADGTPLLVDWQCGQGRVAVWLGMPLGEAPAPALSWWKSAKWPLLLAEALKGTAAP